MFILEYISLPPLPYTCQYHAMLACLPGLEETVPTRRSTVRNGLQEQEIATARVMGPSDDLGKVGVHGSSIGGGNDSIINSNVVSTSSELLRSPDAAGTGVAMASNPGKY